MCFESPGINFGGRDCLFYEGITRASNLGSSKVICEGQICLSGPN